jgi:hypothetical protein
LHRRTSAVETKGGVRAARPADGRRRHWP